MIRRIVEHNKLNGVVFSVEFLVVPAAATFIAVGLGLNDRWLGVVLARARLSTASWSSCSPWLLSDVGTAAIR
jgi:hypothetical protein